MYCLVYTHTANIKKLNDRQGGVELYVLLSLSQLYPILGALLVLDLGSCKHNKSLQ